MTLTYSCSDPTSGTIQNQPPDTYLSLFPDSIIAPGSTLKRINWWGDDPDGLIAGYKFSFDSINWGFTTRNDSTFILSISGNDSTFRFFVAAVDNEGLEDPTPATNLYPVINTPPVVRFDAGTELPDTTFPVASFKWTGEDPDGVETIRYYQWSLNDTLDFKRVPGTTNLITLTQDSGIVVNSDNILYLRAEDNAGALSPIVRMPDTSATWYVRNNNHKILMLRDLNSADITLSNNYFPNAFDTIQYDMLDIKSNSGALIPKIVNPMFTRTLQLFDIVFWVGGNNSVANAANFDLAQQSLPFYIQSGGKVFFSSGFQGPTSPGQGSIINFAPVDSISSCTVPTYLPGSPNLAPYETDYPVIGPSNGFFGIRGIYTTSGKEIYKLFTGAGCFDSITVAIKDTPVNPKVVYFDIPIFYLNNNPANSKALFRRIFIDEFGH